MSKNMDKTRCSTTSEQDTQPSVEGLIARLEAATDGSRELDARIEAAISNWPSDCEFEFGVGGGFLVFRGKSKAIDEARGLYTSSLDAALTLVPQGFAVRNLCIWPGNPADAEIYATVRGEDGRYWHQAHYGRWKAEAATPALALCIAALKARQAYPQIVAGTMIPASKWPLA